MNAFKTNRHILLPYHRSMDRFWKTFLPVAVIFFAIWFLSGRNIPYIGLIPSIPSPLDAILLIASPFLLAISLLGFLARNMAYVQAKKDHLRLVTPFYRINISYRRIQGAHPIKIGQFIVKEKLKKPQRRALEPFSSYTAVIVMLNGYPLSPFLMTLFLDGMVLSPKNPGLVLVIKDWMTLSTEIDSYRGAFQQKQASPPKAFGLLKNLPKK